MPETVIPRISAASASGLNIMHELPAGFLRAEAREMGALLGGPTLIHLAGRRQPALFVCILLHGNETTGLRAIQRVLVRHRGQLLPRALSIFVGNVTAAQYGLRRLDGQPDYNRIWPSAEDATTPEHALAACVTADMGNRGVFASIDVHNNTGVNPHYGCVTCLDAAFLHLATLFARTVVFFRIPRGVQSMAFAGLGPSITIECGKSDSEPGVTRAAEFIDACLHLDHFPTRSLGEHEIDIFHTVAVVTIPAEVAFGFGEPQMPIDFPPDLERMNFRELPPGECLALLNGSARLQVRDEAGQDVFERFFVVESGRLLTRRRVMPAMLTRDSLVIRQDCLCYLMERLKLPPC